MKSVVFYSYPPENDGTSLQGHLLYKGLAEQGQDVLPCHFKESMEKEYFLKHLKPDVAFGVGFWGNVPEIVQSPLSMGITPVPWFNSDGWVANYQKEFDQLEVMFTTSEWVRQTYKRDGVNINKIVPMHIGIDINQFKPSSNPVEDAQVKKMLGIKPHEKMILTVGGDTTSKGAQEMIKALAEVNKEFKDWKYVCKSWPSRCASEWREKELELAESLGLKDKVIFLTDEFSQEFMARMLNSTDVYAAPSRIEGFGMIQVEAMACGKPVISINKMGPAETILHQKTGYLAKAAEEVKLDQEWAYPSMGFRKKQIVKFDSPKTFAYRADINDLRNYTLKLLTEDELRIKMGTAAREHAVKNFDYRIISKNIADITKSRLGLN
ncbi:MAG TPA: glycosyltransferase family 4 protein [Candidatus Nanoarchaeia archaeon]|nr:glycosyltransferase family 4 protein [Candidatus Nanoarchaeia archaeon]